MISKGLTSTVTIKYQNIVIILSLSFVIIFLYSFGPSSLHTKTSRTDVNLRELLAAAIDAAERGGKVVYQVREEATLYEKSKGKTAEGANDPVTEGDIKSHLEMYYSIKKAFPNIEVISEEKSAPSKETIDSISPASKVDLQIQTDEDIYVNADDIKVWIDPLDATQEYTENLRQYVTTMVCVAIKGIPTIGVVHKPFTHFTAWAWAKKDYNPAINVSTKSALLTGPVKAIVSRSHPGVVGEQAKKAFGSDVNVTPAGGAGYKILEVISGEQDLYFHTTLIKKWDLCAGDALLRNFGGKLTDLKGNELDYSSAEDYKNPNGLIAVLRNHYVNLKKLQNVVQV